MQHFQTQGHRYWNEQKQACVSIDRRRLIGWLCLVVAASLLLLQPPQLLAQGKKDWNAWLVSVGGKVEKRGAHQADWVPAKIDDVFAIGDSVRVQAFGSRCSGVCPGR